MEEQIISAGGLHALAYCERLYYLENVEHIRLADERVFAGRRAHEETLPNEEGSWTRVQLESSSLGLRGEVDVLRRIDGALVPYELKRGKSSGKKGDKRAWDTDLLQLGAYALLVEEHFGQPATEGRIRYLADKITIRVEIDAALRERVQKSIKRARQLSETVTRPPVTEHEGRCLHCSLAPACLPEEARLSADPQWRTIRLLPPHPSGSPLHVMESGARVGKSNGTIQVTSLDGPKLEFPVHDVGAVILHGNAQMSTQAIRLCSENEIPVHWVSYSGALLGSLAGGSGGAQRHIRQFEALRDEAMRARLTQATVRCKVEAQLRYCLRSTQGARTESAENGCNEIRRLLRRVAKSTDVEHLRGLEGAAAREYFQLLPQLVSDQVPCELRPDTRTRQPAKDRFSAILNYAYGMLYRQVVTSVLTVGLHPGFGYFHQPRTAALSLSLDIMELFRVPIVDMPVMGALNRKTFHPDNDFEAIPKGYSLSLSGRKKVIELVERRLTETWKHSVVDYSLSYARIIELEVRLLEKEWMNEGGLFAKMRIR